MSLNGPKQIGDYNKNKILSILRERGPTSRVELSRILGISQTAVTRNIFQLLQKGIVRECEAEKSEMGRRPVPIELCNDFCYTLGADIVGGTLKAALADLMGDIVKYYEEPLQISRGAHAVLDQLISLLKKIISGSGIPREKITIAAIGTPGIFDPDTGKSQFTFFLKDWEDIDIRSKIYEALSIETLIENDVNLDVMGERWKGEGKDYENILYIKLGQGLAARVVLDNKLIRGKHKMAGEIGYMMPGLPGEKAVNYENMLCNDAVIKMYRDMAGVNKADTISELCAFADNGDDTARTVIQHLLDQFSLVLLNSATVVDTQVIILGGDACSFGEKEISLLKQRLEQYLPLKQNIVTSKLNKNACLYGAIKVGIDRIDKHITDFWLMEDRV